MHLNAWIILNNTKLVHKILYKDRFYGNYDKNIDFYSI